MHAQLKIKSLLDQLNTVIVGKSVQVQDCVACLLAGGHLLIEDVPGVGKTTLAHALARTFGLQFSRVQFTADLMPSDLTGVSVYERGKESFVFHPGPVFAQVLLADEINRASPKTQSALLEAMEEKQVSVEGETRALPHPFFVIATQNPHDQLGTFALPESQLDRFLMRISIGYPDRAAERLLLAGGDRRDLVALGTVADVVRLDLNNRILVDQGLKRMREGRLTPGLRALFRAAGREPAKATSLDLGFIIGPRLNAAGRLSDMSLGIEALITDDETRALNIAQQLDALNRERKDIESGMQDSALVHLETLENSDGAGIVLFDAHWHQGVIGILAARLKEKLHRPVFAFARGENGQIKGSGRSIPGLHLRDALDLVAKRAPGLLLRFGGHAMAAGATIREDDFPRFRELFAQIADELLSPADLTRTLETDGALEAAYCSIDTARLLENEVWGQGFPAPVFEDEFLVENQRILKEKHLKLRLRKGELRLDAIQFNFSAAPGARIRAAYRLAINDFNGVQTPQLMIEHIENL